MTSNSKPKIIEKQSNPVVKSKSDIKKTVTFDDQTRIKIIPKQTVTKSGRVVKMSCFEIFKFDSHFC